MPSSASLNLQCVGLVAERGHGTRQLRRDHGDRLLLIQKRFGFSSREIARDLGTTVAQVNTAFFRLKQKLLAARGGQESAAPTAVPVEPRRRARTA